MELQEFRQIFYFFQYQFYQRSKRAAKKGTYDLIPHGAIGQFLFNLTLSPEMMHFQWEPAALQERRVVGRRRCNTRLSMRALKREPQSSDPIMPNSCCLKPTKINTAILYTRPHKKTFHCRYMLFDFPRGFRTDHVSSLYKSLIVFDLIEYYGFTTWQLAKTVIGRDITDFFKYRATTKWERLLKDFICQDNDPAVQLMIDKGLIDPNGEDPLLQQILSAKQFTATKNPEYEVFEGCKGSNSFEHLQNLHGVIKSYHRRALRLIELSPTGKFKEFPALLPKS